ncbi:hypothetical protein AVEN_63529-1 [Araneus ventricosus]|uniref:Uncharacterized protein n=1 Tax=Araneus ventricosus TaxID=182803 RepID=A0A4Y2VK00_ARAVE|nr:hypothetical protein AVEN_63529-1 [Araneus ventricosus]
MWKLMTSKYVIKGRLPPTNLHFREKSIKILLHCTFCLRETLKMYPSPNYLTDLKLLILLWKLMTSRYAIKCHPPPSIFEETKYGFLQIFPCDVTPCQKHYTYSAVGINGERLRSGNAFEESLRRFVCSASWKAGELSVIESTVTVIMSELLSVSVPRSGSVVTVIASDLLSVYIDNMRKAIVPVTCPSCFSEYL